VDTMLTCDPNTYPDMASYVVLPPFFSITPQGVGTGVGCLPPPALPDHHAALHVHEHHGERAMIRYVVALVAVAIAGAGGGFLLGVRTVPRPAPPAPGVAGSASPEAMPANVTQPLVPSDYQALKNQLAICMAFHPSSDMQDKQLSMCRGELAACRSPRETLPACYDFIDFAPIYDHELGEADPSPETIRAGQELDRRGVRPRDHVVHAGQDPAGDVPQGRSAAGLQGALTARSWIDPSSRPARRPRSEGTCTNAWFRREEDRAREMGHEWSQRIRMAADGGMLMGPTSSIPDND